jgi:hypothetical protein
MDYAIVHENLESVKILLGWFNGYDFTRITYLCIRENAAFILIHIFNTYYDHVLVNETVLNAVANTKSANIRSLFIMEIIANKSLYDNVVTIIRANTTEDIHSLSIILPQVEEMNLHEKYFVITGKRVVRLRMTHITELIKHHPDIGVQLINMVGRVDLFLDQLVNE